MPKQAEATDRPLLDLAVEALEDRKASDVAVLDVRALTDVCDHMVVASGRSRRQVKAIAENVVTAAKRAGHPPIGVEGLDAGEWVLVDLVDVVVHVMEPETRAFYLLEKLWGGADSGGEESTRRSSP